MISYEEQNGKFAKHCPCSPDTVPCGYHNLNLHTGCSFSCSYCILQTYLDTMKPVYFTNLEDMESELREISQTRRHLRIGTGELADSLAFDRETGYSRKLLDILAKFPDIVFEFKTKSINIDNILNYPRKLDNVVVSWSLNPQEVIEREELLTPDLLARLEAVGKAREAGYKIGFHFDPLLIFDGWEEAYTQLITEISKIVEARDIAWWSMGALRFPVSLREHILKYKRSRLFEGELVKGFDGKYRYYKPLRLELFRYVKREIHRIVSPEAPLYLCMEDPETWREVLPELPPDEDVVNQFLYESALNPG
ncbi:MAG: hypothetical protein GY940_01105 [bacterium]|nr:hypothetical protein [bacterium]